MSIDWLILVYTLIGGLALFLFGMDVMTKALKSSAGNQLKTFLYKMTATRWKALLAGTGITAIIQSSSVTTVLAVGFVSAGLMSFQSTLGLILGANIGTTITAQIIAFKITQTALLLVTIGYLFTLIPKERKYKEVGKVLLGLGLIFLGMNFMSEGMQPLKSYPPFIDIMHNLNNPAMGILVGAVFTALVQSSSATTGVVIVLASQGLISTQGGISIIIGANIGTCVTAFLSAIGKPRAAMQVAIAHISFKIIGALIWISFIPQLASVAEHITPLDLPRQIANAHTIFNVSNAILLIGFTSPMASVIMKFFPDKAVKSAKEISLLDDYYLENTSLALDLVNKELNKLSNKTIKMLDKSANIIFNGTQQELNKLRETDKRIDFYQKQILTYLQQIQQQELKPAESKRLKQQLEVANLLEAVADVITTDMTESAEHRIQHKFEISDETLNQFYNLYKQSSSVLILSYKAIQNNNAQKAQQALSLKPDFKEAVLELKKRLTDRLSEPDENRIAIIRFETEMIELVSRIHALARSLAKEVYI